MWQCWFRTLAPTVTDAAALRYNQRWWRWDPAATVERGVLALHAWVRGGYREEALTMGHVGQLLVFAT